MPVGKIAVLRSPYDALVQGLETADVPPPFIGDRWTGYRGKNGGIFHAATIDGGALVVPFGVFDTPEEIALAVRGVLGAALDRHDDSRGLFIVEGDSPPESSYDDTVAAAGVFIAVPPADDARLSKEEGWSFAAAANAFSSPDAKKRVEQQAETDPFASAKATFDTKLASREERGALRRTLSAALNHEVDHSAVGKAASEEEENRAVSNVADHLMRAVASNPDKTTEMEHVLREAVDKDIAREEPMDESQIPPPAEDGVITTSGEEVAGDASTKA